MLSAAVICGLVFPLIWFVPAGWSEIGYAGYLFAALLIYFSAYSFFNIPLIALAFEATPDYGERTSVQAYKAFFVHSMGIISGWLFVITQLNAFDGTMDGARVAGLAVGATIIVVGLVPTLAVREGFQEVARKEVIVREKRLSFFQYIKLTLSNRPFLIICLIQICMGVSGAIVGSFGLYILIYHVYAGDKLAAGVLYGTWHTVFQAATIIIIPLITWCASRLGKIKSLRLFLMLLVLGSLSKWFVFNPDFPYLALLAVIALGPAQTAYYMIIRSIIADICDDDELSTGLRREGAYGAMYSWIGKVDGSLGIFIAGLVLVWIGFDASQGSVQDPNTVFYMRLAFSGFPMAGAILALTALKFFPLTEDRCRQIRLELESRRGVAKASDL
jgi:GPH family glycoside/pentoside/hexuronide:cation symporter